MKSIFFLLLLFCQYQALTQVLHFGYSDYSGNMFFQGKNIYTDIVPEISNSQINDLLQDEFIISWPGYGHVYCDSLKFFFRKGYKIARQDGKTSIQLKYFDFRSSGNRMINKAELVKIMIAGCECEVYGQLLNDQEEFSKKISGHSYSFESVVPDIAKVYFLVYQSGDVSDIQDFKLQDTIFRYIEKAEILNDSLKEKVLNLVLDNCSFNYIPTLSGVYDFSLVFVDRGDRFIGKMDFNYSLTYSLMFYSREMNKYLSHVGEIYHKKFVELEELLSPYLDKLQK
ncbi:hypothetical protein RCC89_10670 [Cytophagaceae bacterium ABcell3]|nr:hypothetical protein RCC89_10670 [Cytophagaceae bacterium ABcell3]